MISRDVRKLWFPVVVAIVCILASLLIGYILHINSQDDADFLLLIKTRLPGLIALFGVIFSILIGTLLGVTQLARAQALKLEKTNEDLKKEINERIITEEAKQQLEVALLQGQKLQAIGTLAGGIAHDFNNLLYAIIGYTEMAREDVAKDSISYKNLGKILEATNRGRELVSRILAFSRRQQHQFDIIHLKTTIEAVLALLRPTIPAGVMIQFDKSYPVDIYGNQTQIHQVMVNLINNAVDAMEDEGTIKIALEPIELNDPLLKQFQHQSQQEYCKITVSDTGHGMDQTMTERIFEPFFTTKEVGKGTGLGLSIVHSIMKEHQGEIIVKSQLGHGTTFILIFAIAK